MTRVLSSPVSPTDWLTLEQIASDTKILASAVAGQVDGVVGMARSGMLAAVPLATLLHVPMASMSEAGYVSLPGGWRSRELLNGFKSILLVDDTVCSGRTMERVLPMLQAVRPRSRITTAVMYSSRSEAPWLDLVVREYPTYHYMEWNYFNSILVHRCACDLDGIFCHDVPAHCDDDGELYLDTIANATPLYTATRNPIPVIITARLEKYREVTQAWLAHYGIFTTDLRMGPWRNNDERSRPFAIAEWKAGEFACTEAEIFVESDPRQAPVIAKLSGKQVLCPAAKRIFTP